MKKLLLITAIAIIAAAGCKKDNKEKGKQVEYTVTFDADGGAPVPPKQTVEAGEVATAPNSPAKAGYVFMYWSLNGANTAYNFQTPVTGDITLVAKWQSEATVEYWQVSWNLNGGAWATGYTPPAQVVKGGTLAEPTPPTKAGSTLEGWYKEAALTNKVNFPYDVSGVTANFTLYAKWTGGSTNAEYWQVTWELDGGSWPANDNHVAQFRKDDPYRFILLPYAPMKAGKHFLGWYTDETLSNKVTFPFFLRGDITLYAKWDDAKASYYFGTWTNFINTYYNKVIISDDTFGYINSNGDGFTISELTWTEAVNQNSATLGECTTGFKVTGKLTALSGGYFMDVHKPDGSSNVVVGDIVVISFFRNDSYDLPRILLGNIFDAGDEEAKYGGLIKYGEGYWQVTWDLNGGAWPANDNHATQVKKDDFLYAPNPPVKEGFYFGGWFTEASFTNQVKFPYPAGSITSDFTLYFKWSDTPPPVRTGTISVTVDALAGFYTIINAGTGYNIPTSSGTHTITVPVGTYRIYVTYWTCQYIGCQTSNTSSSFTVSEGQTRNVTIVGSGIAIN